MLTLLGGAGRALLLAIVGLIAVVIQTAAPVAHAQPAPEGATIIADLTLNEDGVLEVEEQVTVPPGDTFQMSLPLRVEVGENSERRFEVTDIETSGAGTANTDNGLFTTEAGPGESTFRYSVRNTVSEGEGGQVFRWLGMLAEDVAKIDASLVSPSFEMGIVQCTLGSPWQTRPCANVEIEPDGVLYLEQTDIAKGEAVDLVLHIPPGTVAADAETSESLGRSFAITVPALIAFAILALAVAALVGYVLLTRREPEKDRGSIDPLAHADGHTQFTSPDGLLPGAVGALLDENADPADIAATVVDLAVRRYVWITPVNDSDWRITRMNPTDDQLCAYEKAVYQTVLPDGTDAVTLTELRASGRTGLAPLRSAVIAELQHCGAFHSTARRRLPLWLGAALIVAGVATTVVTTLTSGHALVGVAIALGGLAAVLLPRYLPTRTAHGRVLTGRIRALQRGLDAVRREQVSPSDQELVFSRALPYTVVWNGTDSWIRTFRDLDPSADQEPGLYWFGGFDRDRNLHRFAAHFPYFITALETLFSAP